MCARVANNLSKEDYLELFNLEPPPFSITYNAAPTSKLPIVRQIETQRSLTLAQWGFDTHQAGKVLFNARGETVSRLPSFKEAFKKRRALLPVRGWYEWRLQGGRKQPYFLHRRDHKPVVMAALWEEGTPERFTVITTGASREMSEYHHRMPVILLSKDWEGWLEGTQGEDLLVPFTPGVLTGQRVGLEVNSVQNDHQGLLGEAIQQSP